MKNQHNWIAVAPPSVVPLFICQNCQGVKVKDYSGKFHYFYKGRIQHC